MSNIPANIAEMLQPINLIGLYQKHGQRPRPHSVCNNRESCCAMGVIALELGLVLPAEEERDAEYTESAKLLSRAVGVELFAIERGFDSGLKGHDAPGEDRTEGAHVGYAAGVACREAFAYEYRGTE